MSKDEFRYMLNRAERGEDPFIVDTVFYRGAFRPTDGEEDFINAMYQYGYVLVAVIPHHGDSYRYYFRHEYDVQKAKQYTEALGPDYRRQMLRTQC